MNDMLTHALNYAGRGWPIFPLHTPVNDKCSCNKTSCTGKDVGKHPRWRKDDLEHGLEGASTDLDKIHSWWSQWPDANIAVRTGIVCDMFDLDHDDQLEGTKDWPWAVDMPGGPVVRTGAGWHYYLQPTGLGNRTRFTEHCDWRGENGYSILPPSLHYSGRRYEWFTPYTLPLNPCPEDLLAILALESPPGELPAWQFTSPAKVSGSHFSSPRSTRPIDKDRFTRGRWTASGVIGKMAMAPEGYRNDTLVWAANMIGLDYHDGKATKAEVERARDQLHDVAVRTGLGEDAVRATIKSGFEKGIAGKINYTGKRKAAQ